MKIRGLLFCFMASAATAFFLPMASNMFNSRTYTKICLYSNDPTQFQPMCIMCPNPLYATVISTCMRGAAIPNNVSYTQANCIVGNCAINITRRRRDDSEDPTSISERIMQLKAVTLQPEEITEFRVPYVAVISGKNITVTSVQEYFVHSENEVQTPSDIS